jgi:prepilin-type processing-associated H-X9-DG protein
MRTRLSLLIVLLLPLAVIAQPLADRVPNDALIYIGSRGLDSMGPGYEGSHLKAVLDASDFSQLVNEFLPQVLQKVGQQDPESGEILSAISAIARPLLKHPHAIYVGGLDMTGPQPMPRIAVLCQAGADAPQFLAAVQKLIAKAQGGPVPLAAREFEGLVIVTLGKMSPAFDAATSAEGGVAQSLSRDKGFKDAMGQLVKDPSVALYVNFEGILATAGQVVQAVGDPKAKELFPKIRDALGLAGLKSISYAGGFDGKDWMEAAYIAAPSPRTGLLKLFDAKPLSADTLKVAPKSSVEVAAGRFNFAGLVGQIRDGIRQFDPNAGDQVDAVLGQISQMLGMDVQKDLLGSLGDEWVGYSDPNTGGYGFGGTVLVNRLADAAKAEQSFSKLEQFINQIVASNLRNEKVTISIQTRQAGDLTLHYLAVPLITPTWAIKDGNMYLALYPQVVMAAADFVSRKGPSILENEEFIAVQKRVGGEGAAGVQFSDLAREAPVNYAGWVALSRIVGIGDLFGIKSPIVVLPPLSRIMANIGPAGSASWADESGVHVKSVCPFPGSTVLSTDPISAYMSAAPALSLSILLPSLSKAREAANRVKSGSNLRQIGQGCLLYANENNGKMPPDLGSLVKEELTPEVFVSPLGHQQVPREVATMTPEQKAAWINEHSDYVYLGKGKMNNLPADQPVAYEKFENGHGQGISILFGDGHVEFESMPEAQRIIATNKEGRQ